MPKSWFIADPHLGYSKVAKERGFNSTYEHDYRVTRDIVEPIQPNDNLYLIGDITSRFANEQEYRRFFEDLCIAYNDVHCTAYPRLPFNIHIIMGNHDEFHELNQMIKQGFIKSVSACLEFPLYEDFSESIVVTHIPLHPGELTKETRWVFNVHGHLHEYKVDDDRYYCVSYDRVINPVELGTLSKLALISAYERRSK